MADSAAELRAIFALLREFRVTKFKRDGFEVELELPPVDTEPGLSAVGKAAEIPYEEALYYSAPPPPQPDDDKTPPQ